MRAFLLLLVALAILLVAGDVAATTYIERAAAREVTLRINAPATVDLEGWPVVPRLATSAGVPRARVSATAVPLQGVQLSLARVDVTLTNVRLPLLLEGDLTVLAADSASYVATIDQTGLQSLTAQAQANQVGQVQILPDRIQLLVAGITADLLVGARDGAVVLTLANAPLPELNGREFVLPVSGLPAGARIESAVIRGGVLQLAGPIEVHQLLPVRTVTR